MKKRKFKLIFYATNPSGTILNVDKFICLRDKLPTDVDVFRRIMIQKQTGIIEPYLIYLNKKEYDIFRKEFRQKVLTSIISHSIIIEGTNIEIAKIKMIENV